MNYSSVDEKAQKRRIRKISLLILLIAITGIVLIVETYAWFVGISTVNTNEFSVTISGETGLEFSLTANSNDWHSDTLTISEAAITSAISSSYSGNTNKWLDGNSSTTTDGLVPISTSGEIDTSSSRLKLFGKSALASTGGGYKIIASPITNSTTEGDGYVTFDLFIRNGQNGAYSTANNSTADESIYLSKSSKVVVTPAGQGGGNPNYGVANSMRVAFAQIGRVRYDKTGSTAQKISCSTAGDVIGLCSNTGATTIWEPNETVHDQNLINYYNLACVGKSVASSITTYSGSCTSLARTNSFVHTYTVGKTIASGDNVDVYDGLNGYTGSIGASSFLRDTDTFTDTEKSPSSNSNRQAFFKLAANSITKVRVYIYLEGQDVDNYDLITKGKKINIQFGLTKDKFEINSSSPTS